LSYRRSIGKVGDQKINGFRWATGEVDKLHHGDWSWRNWKMKHRAGGKPGAFGMGGSDRKGNVGDSRENQRLENTSTSVGQKDQGVTP